MTSNTPYFSALIVLISSVTSHSTPPFDIEQQKQQIIVNRRGTTANSFMVTETIVGFVKPGELYQVQQNGLRNYQGTVPPPGKISETIKTPSHLKLIGHWDNRAITAAQGNNILGGNGTLWTIKKSIEIPVADTSHDNLAFYGARLLSIGDVLQFDTESNLPITTVNTGIGYVQDFLMKESHGGGMYLEYHDRPHFHMPIEDAAGGQLILGKKVGEIYLLSAFNIPQGRAIYTPPNVIHNDSFLTGRNCVVYSLTKNFSTVIIRSYDQRLVNVSIARQTPN